MSDTPGDKVLVYDGDCGFCRYCVDYARARTGDEVDYRPYQSLPENEEGPSDADYARAIYFYEYGALIATGAGAAFAVIDRAGSGLWWWLYRNLPAFTVLSEWFYRRVANHRPLCHTLARVLIGRQWRPLRYDGVIGLFTRGLALVYLLAFISFAVQAQGLIGSDGILPFAEHFTAAGEQLGAAAPWRLPGLLWFWRSDSALGLLCVAGIAGSLWMYSRRAPRLSALLCYLCYLSLASASQVFMRYQWDALLLECGVLALVLAQWPRLGIWLYRWLLFRFVFMSGAVKLLSGDENWWNLTALTYHFETQPLPTPLAWYAHHWPESLLVVLAGAVFVVELFIPFLMLLTRQPRRLAAILVALFQLAIALTGNYNFFNLLTLLLCLPLLDDAMLPARFMPQRGVDTHAARNFRSSRLHSAAAAIVGVFIVSISTIQLSLQFGKSPSYVTTALVRQIAPFHAVNNYGVFAVMTTRREEILIEASMDGETWHPYRFRYKPDRLARAPTWVAPHQPRLDWQLWFAGLSRYPDQYWFQQLVDRLLTAEPAVLALFESAPFGKTSPRLIRAWLYHYRYSTPKARADSGHWWKRELLWQYMPLAGRSRGTDHSTSH